MNLESAVLTLVAMIHPTAIIHPRAEVDPGATLGPYTVIDEGVVVGPGCTFGPHCHITGLTTIGAGNRFHAGCVIGDAPQDLKYRGEPTGLRIGEGNVFREYMTVSRSNKPEEPTVIGSHGYFMAYSHVGHNSAVGDHVIMTNCSALGGHVLVQDRAFISTGCMVHQFVRVGTLSLMQGGSAISKDLPPFTIARGDNGMCGLNVVGLRRAGFTPEQRSDLKKLYRLLFRSGRLRSDAVRDAGPTEPGSPAAQLIEFVISSKRGLCTDTGQRKTEGE
ncbi:MAG: acyl-ACP--UDP-N-acetylglucosamine O-acyltransferase [Verrucomicrobia bacterium]|nr:acyl-ACP--UDP-N-acetylglucosamine O-acyltransferase [Verrucomicrobiota bacterium]